MNVNLKRLENFHLVGKGSSNIEVHVDASEEIGGNEAGARPMELLLMGLGSCSSIDILNILSKQKIEIEEFTVDINAERYTDEIPSVFKSINLHFIVRANASSEQIKRAIDLSINKYCSAAAVINKTANISTSFQLN